MRHLPTILALCLLGCRATPADPSSPASTPTASRPACASELQGDVERLLAEAGHPGALVVLDLEHEAELAAAFASLDPETPLPPASTLKPFLAAQALDEGVIDPSETIACAGSWTRDDETFTCFMEHGPLDLPSALATSCNVYFYELVSRMGPEAVARAFHRFELESIASAWEQAPEMATAIGHGDAHVTVRQLAHAYAALARDRGPALAPVHTGLRKAVEAELGTATTARVQGLSVAGKTGTTESEVDGATHMHAWFAGYAPADDPHVLVVAYLDASDTGSKIAAPLAGRVFAAWRDRCASTDG